MMEYYFARLSIFKKEQLTAIATINKQPNETQRVTKGLLHNATQKASGAVRYI